MKGKFFLLVLFISSLLSAGCRSADSCLKMETSMERGDYSEAAEEVKRQKDTSYYKNKNRLLFYLDCGFASHYAGRYEESINMLDEAERLVEELYTKSVMREAGSYLINDNVKEYAGEEYESLYIHIFKCLDYIALADFENAMVEIRKANLKLELLEDKYRKIFSDYNDSEDAEFQVPEVKNHFHNSALSRYLGTLLYRNDRASDDARIEAEGLRNAFAEQAGIYDFSVPDPPAVEFPKEEALLDFVVFSGLGPVKKPLGMVVTVTKDMMTFSATGYDNEYVESLLGFTAFPVFGAEGPDVIRFELPVLVHRSLPADRICVAVSGKGISEKKLELLENVNNIASDTYKMKLPFIVIKSAVRIIGKQIGSSQGEKAIEAASHDSGLAALGGLLFDVIAAATESADLRGCFFLPGYVYSGEIALPPGEYDISVDYYIRGKLVRRDVKTGVKAEKGRLNLIESFNF